MEDSVMVVELVAVAPVVLSSGEANVSSGRPWTPDEDAFLEENYPRKGVFWIATKLHRSRRAIERRVKRLRLRKADDGQGYTITDLMLAGIVGDYRTIQNWIRTGKLAAERRNSERLHDFWLITPKALRRFVAQYPLEIDLALVKKRGGEVFLFDLLLGSTHGAGQFGRTDDEAERDEARMERDAEGEEE